MSHVTEPSAGLEPRPGSEPGRPPVSPRRPRRRTFPILMILLSLLIVVLLVIIWSRFITFNPHIGRLDPAQHPLYFPVLMVHIVGSTVAIVTCVLQIWPWLRRNHLRVHRISGRVYVFAGIIPAALSSLAISAFWPYSPFTVSSDILLAVLWLGTTLFGYRLIRQGRIADHRRWMLRSFALTASTLVNQTIGPPLGLLLRPMKDTFFAGSDFVFMQAWSGIDGWLGWILAFLAVEFWLDRDQLKRSRRRVS